MATYTRPLLGTLVERLRESRQTIQVLAGPRQVGKTTLAQQAVQRLAMPAHYASADGPTLRDASWIAQQWDAARFRARGGAADGLLVLDEIQKVTGWAESVKAEWDRDTREGFGLRVLLLGSAPLLVQQGLTESLAGRFELIRIPHWSWTEMRDAFGWELDQYVFFGGYPGSAPLVGDEERWGSYIRDALIETSVSRDILLMTRVDKPALLRRLMELSCAYSGQVLSYNKMLGQLQDAGNTVTLAHYLDLLAGAGMVVGLQKYAGQRVRRRASSPKLQVLNVALVSALARRSFADVRLDPPAWGRLVESTVGAHLLNTTMRTPIEVYYWRERNREIDFVLRLSDRLVAIEVKSGRPPAHLPGMSAFVRSFSPEVRLLVGADGLPLGEFLAQPANAWFAGE
ncbi:MAG: ATP-binding protein [Deltaproteobacteria bacterium]|nr:ATP-binding protein [Deltaproteobacteria bacterium]